MDVRTLGAEISAAVVGAREAQEHAVTGQQHQHIASLIETARAKAVELQLALGVLRNAARSAGEAEKASLTLIGEVTSIIDYLEINTEVAGDARGQLSNAEGTMDRGFIRSRVGYTALSGHADNAHDQTYAILSELDNAELAAHEGFTGAEEATDSIGRSIQILKGYALHNEIPLLYNGE